MFQIDISKSTGIHDPETFMRTFAPGVTFWTIDSSFGEPMATVKYKFVSIDQSGHWIVVENDPWHSRFPQSLNDLCNGYHGVFTTEEAATAELERRRTAFAVSPDWQAEVARQRGGSEKNDHVEYEPTGHEDAEGHWVEVSPYG